MKSSKKYYLIYLTAPPDFYKDFLPNESSKLYAYTDEKSTFKLFKKQRLMKYFSVKKMSLDKKDIHRLTKEHQRKRLEVKGLKTPGVSYDNKTCSIETVEFAMTESEINIVTSTSIKIMNVDLIGSAKVDPYIFKKKYIDALETLGYTSLYGIFRGKKILRENEGSMYVSTMDKCEVMDYWDYLNLVDSDIQMLFNSGDNIDTLMIFINIYGKLLNIKGGEVR